jgi:hypothetical protein
LQVVVLKLNQPPDPLPTIKPIQPTIQPLVCHAISPVDLEFKILEESVIGIVVEKVEEVKEVVEKVEKVEDIVDLTGALSPVLSVPTCLPPKPRLPKRMAAQPVYHDRAYSAIKFQAEFNNDFANTLAAICKITVNTRCYLYAAGITSMEAVVEFFSTHDAASKFIDTVMKKEGKEVSIPLYCDPNYAKAKISFCVFH